MTKNLVAALLIGSVTAVAGVRAEVVKTCQLADGAATAVRVSREHPILNTHVYTLRYSSNTRYFFEDKQDSRGGPVTILCVGQKERALVVYGEFAANYLQGFALIYNAGTQNIERLDFAEKGPPEWLYLNEAEAIVVARTDGAGENGGKPYAAYRYKKGRMGQPVIEGLDVPRRPPGFLSFQLREQMVDGSSKDRPSSQKGKSR